jgi:adenosine/AMP kinase
MTQPAGAVEIHLVAVQKPDELNMILGQSHFIKTVEDVHEALAGAVPGLRFGLAFCEASGPRLVRRSGNDPELVELATANALAIGAGHSFIVFLREGFPVNVLPAVRLVPEVCRIYCATANPVSVIVGETSVGRAILGVVDGESPLGVESESDVAERKQLLRELGYKL